MVDECTRMAGEAPSWKTFNNWDNNEIVKECGILDLPENVG